MAKHIESKPQAVRLGPGAFELLEKNKTKGRFYCQVEDGILIWINDNGRVKKYKCKNMYECEKILGN